MKIRPSCF